MKVLCTRKSISPYFRKGQVAVQDLPYVDVNLDFPVSADSITILRESFNFQSKGSFSFFLGQDIISQGCLKQTGETKAFIFVLNLLLLDNLYFPLVHISFSVLKLRSTSWDLTSHLWHFRNPGRSHLDVHTSRPRHGCAVLSRDLWQSHLLQQ